MKLNSVRYGGKFVEETSHSDPATVEQIVADKKVQKALGYDDADVPNLVVLIDDVEQSPSTVVQQGATLVLQNRNYSFGQQPKSKSKSPDKQAGSLEVKSITYSTKTVENPVYSGPVTVREMLEDKKLQQALCFNAIDHLRVSADAQDLEFDDLVPEDSVIVIENRGPRANAYGVIQGEPMPNRGPTGKHFGSWPKGSAANPSGYTQHAKAEAASASSPSGYKGSKSAASWNCGK